MRVFGQIGIFQSVKVIHYSFADVEGLGTPGPLGEISETLFYGLRKTDSKHAIRV